MKPVPSPTIDHSRPDAGESEKDLRTPGSDLAAHKRVDDAIDGPEFEVKAAYVAGYRLRSKQRLGRVSGVKRAQAPSWLVSYAHLLKGGRVGSALIHAHAMEQAAAAGGDAALAKAAWAAYRTELQKVLGAYAAPAAGIGASGMGVAKAMRPEPSAWDKFKANLKA